MGITINKQVSVTIDGKDYDILSNILELARRRIRESEISCSYTTSKRDPFAVDEFSLQEVNEMTRAMDKIWDN